MMRSLKLWRLSRAVRSRQAEQVYSAILELGRMGGPEAVKLLLRALERDGGIARSAARELGRVGDVAAVGPLVAMLDRREVGQSAYEALVRLGGVAVELLAAALRDESPDRRQRAAEALGEIGEKRAVESLVQVVQGDPDYAVRTSAVRALGQIKDARAVWVLVGVLKLRDEAVLERQAAVEALRQAARVALHKIGDPLAAGQGRGSRSMEEVVAELESTVAVAEAHPRLVGDIGLASEGELVGVLKELIAASEEVSWARLENREPLLAPYFASYEQRRETAEKLGEELCRRGGRKLLNRILAEQLDQYPAIKNWWAEITSP